MPTASMYSTLTLAAFALTVALCVAALAIDGAVNLNRFSMHAVYRNRLIRGFLGPARGEARTPDRFTQFDPGDNVRLADTWKSDWRRPLFPVINVALNTTVGQDTAKAERKASSFTMTPLRCGSADLLNGGAYIQTSCYGGADKETGPGDEERGVTLGTAMTISGAAVSPNMGYNSSPALAFLMTLFNVRLGAWLPNPALSTDPKHSNESGPRHGMRTLLSELTGQATDASQFVYLSDGGHFDNLGLYEMLKRRCRRIVVVDAGRDENYDYADVGHALQRALIDFRVKVNFVQSLNVGKDKLSLTGAYAEIRYSSEDPKRPETGQLIYLKPWLPPGMPTELKVFKALKPSFPHETTTDQFFAESDFESYRRLGEYLGNGLIGGCLEAAADKRRSQGQPPAADEAGGSPGSPDLGDLFSGAEHIANSPGVEQEL